jgi:hypothetical protein
MDRAPILEVGAVKIGQSKTIERYIARVCKLSGSSELESAQIDCIAEHVRDIKEKYGKIRSLQGPEKDAAMKKWFEEGELVDWLDKLEKSLPLSKAESCAVGTKTSYADVCIWHLLRDHFDNKESVANASKACVRITRIADKISNIAAVKSWLAERPHTMF